MADNNENKSHRAIIIVLCVLSVLIIAVSVALVVINLNKKGAIGPSGQGQQSENGIKISSEDYEKNEKIIEEINDHIYPITEEEAVEYLDKKAEEYQDDSIGLAVAQIKVNMFYNALEYEKAAECGHEIEEKYDISKYPTTYRLSFYYEMMEIYKALGNEEKAEEYNKLGKSISDKYYEGGLVINGDN